MRIGVLTGGGDCPGLNAAIRAVVRRAIESYGDSVLGIRNGWAGLIEGDVEPLSLYSVSGILCKGGTILGTSRGNPFKSQDDLHKMGDNIRKFELEAIAVIGGDGTLRITHELFKRGFPCVGIPKTIDNDVWGTDYTIGFDTAVSIATDAIDRLHSTAESHHRIMVIEVMGRHAGWIAVMAGMAGGADCILIPEVPFSIYEVCELLRTRHLRGKNFSIVVVAEGAISRDEQFIIPPREVDEFGHVRLGGIGGLLGKEIERRIGIETRVTTLGYIQRGGPPTPFDRILATRFGVRATDLVHEGNFGKMVALRGHSIEVVDLEEVTSRNKLVDLELYETASVFFG